MESESCLWLHMKLCKPLTRMVFTLVLNCHVHIEKSGTKKKNPQISMATLQNNLSGLINGVPTRKRLSALMLCALASINI